MQKHFHNFPKERKNTERFITAVKFAVTTSAVVFEAALIHFVVTYCQGNITQSIAEF